MADCAAMADDQAFPGRQLTILSVDDSLVCLRILEAKLLQCKYHVISTSSAAEALSILRAKDPKFDIIITDVHMPDMDGFELLKQVGLEMDLPCIMVSGDDDTKTVIKGIDHGACDYLLKPVRIQELRTIWKHILRKKKVNKASVKDSGNATSDSSTENVEGRKRKGRGVEEEDERDTEEPKKKTRMIWTQELQSKFIKAIVTLGAYKAVPAKILEFMRVEGLTREHVASHLQKHRECLRKMERKADMIVSMGPQSHPPLPLYNQQNMMGSGSNLTLLQDSQQDTMGPQSHVSLLEYREENTMGSRSHLPLLQSSQENGTGSQSHLPLLQSSKQNMMLANTNIHQGFSRPRVPYPITDLGSRFLPGTSSNQQAGSSSLPTRLPQFQRNSSDSFSPNPAHSHNAVSSFSTTSGLSPTATLNASNSDYRPLGYPLSRSLESLNSNTNTSNFSGTNQGSLIFNARDFATGASQGCDTIQNFPLSHGTESLNINNNTNGFSGMNQGSLNVNFRNIVNGTSQGLNPTQNLNYGNFDLSGNSQNQMLDNAMGHSPVAMNVTEQPDYNSNMNPGQQLTHDTTRTDVFASYGNSQNQVLHNATGHSELAVDITDWSNPDSNVIPGQQFMFDAENQFESGDGVFMENSSMQGETGLSADMFSGFDVLLNQDEPAAWLPDNGQEQNH